MTTRIRHFPKLGLTMASEPGPSGHGMAVALAVTHSRDQFSRRMGRMIAEGRLTAKRNFYRVVSVDDFRDAVIVAREAGDEFTVEGARRVLLNMVR